MNRPLDFFFFVGSTYTHLAVHRADALAARAGVTLRWRPFSVRKRMLEQNNRPFAGKPAKLAYMWRDLERRAQRHGVPFAAIPAYPIDADELANRVATIAASEGWCPQFAKAAYASWFIENKDPGKVEHLSALLQGLGREPGPIIARADSGAVRAQYEAQTDTARALGIFGSPTFVCDKEIFWGDDRLEDAIDWCKSR